MYKVSICLILFSDLELSLEILTILEYSSICKLSILTIVVLLYPFPAGISKTPFLKRSELSLRLELQDENSTIITSIPTDFFH